MQSEEELAGQAEQAMRALQTRVASCDRLLAAMEPAVTDELINRITAALNTPSQKRANTVCALATVLLGSLSLDDLTFQAEVVIVLIRRLVAAKHSEIARQAHPAPQQAENN